MNDIAKFAPDADAGMPEAVGGSFPVHGVDGLLHG